MRRHRDHASETSSHPFRSLFDLMTALVLLLLAAFVLRQPRERMNYDARQRQEEFLLLYNLKLRQERGDNAPLLHSLDQIDPHDVARRLLTADTRPLSEAEKEAIEKRRGALWREVAPFMRERLLSQRILRAIGQDKLEFPTGSALPSQPQRLAPILQDIFAQSYDTLRSRLLVKRIRVEGHTDSQPISTAQFPSNWELSSARAIWLAKQIEQYFQARHVPIGKNGILIEAIGYADRFPLAGNDNLTAAHRHLNRRIEIVFEK